MTNEWINVGKWDDFLAGKKQIIVYANTVEMMWRIGVITNDPHRERRERWETDIS